MVASTSIPTPAGEPPAPFLPDPDQATLLFEALASPALSFQQVAAQFNISVEALSIFITASRGREVLAGLNAALLARLQFIALSTLPSVVTSLAAIVDDHARFEAAEPAETLSSLAARSSPSAPSATPDPLARFKLLERKRINARKAASLLFRIATLRPRTPRPDHPATPPRDPSTTKHTFRAAHTPPPSPAAPASSTAAHHSSLAWPDAMDLLDPLDPVDRFSIPTVLRACAPSTPEPIAQATCPPLVIPAPGHIHPIARPAAGASSLWPSPLTTTMALLPALTPPPAPPLFSSAMTAARSLMQHAGSTIPLPAPPSPVPRTLATLMSGP